MKQAINFFKWPCHIYESGCSRTSFCRIFWTLFFCGMFRPFPFFFFFARVCWKMARTNVKINSKTALGYHFVAVM